MTNKITLTRGGKILKVITKLATGRGGKKFAWFAFSAFTTLVQHFPIHYVPHFASLPCINGMRKYCANLEEDENTIISDFWCIFKTEKNVSDTLSFHFSSFLPLINFSHARMIYTVILMFESTSILKLPVLPSFSPPSTTQ